VADISNTRMLHDVSQGGIFRVTVNRRITSKLVTQGPFRVNNGPSAAPPRRSVPEGKADVIGAKADFSA
jgi:hypothetical protein